MNATDIAEPSQTVRVQLRLRELILGGELKPGARIAELTLVERLNASRTPIRMALVRLQEEGLLEALPHGGFAVKDFSEADIHDAIELRGTLSGEHGIGTSKSEFLPLEQSPELIEIQRKLKAVFDPRGLLNPHKIFPRRTHGSC